MVRQTLKKASRAKKKFIEKTEAFKVEPPRGTGILTQVQTPFFRKRTPFRQAGELDDVPIKYARFARASYGTDTELPYGFQKDEALSDEYTSVYYSPNEVVTSFRGTKTADDILTDVFIAAHKEDISPRFINSRAKYAEVLDKYPEKQHSLASHSLGGAINDYVYTKYDTEVAHVYNYNKATNLNTLARDLGRSLFIADQKVTDYHIQGDPVSFLGLGDNNVTLRPLEGVHPHTINQFLE